eukprot:6770904-Lingulodinium_polyedra.AAC.1
MGASIAGRVCARAVRCRACGVRATCSFLVQNSRFFFQLLGVRARVMQWHSLFAASTSARRVTALTTTRALCFMCASVAPALLRTLVRVHLHALLTHRGRAA